MFGYIKPATGELLVKEYELYRAVYCGLCRVGGKKVSRLTRLFLSYDFTALATLRLALTDCEAKTERKRCPYGLKRRPVLCCDEVLGFTAAAFACLGYRKVLDDVKDERGFKRFAKRLSLPLFKRMVRRSSKLYPKLYAAVSSPLDTLALSETDGVAHTLDEYADGGAAALGVIASYGLSGAAASVAYEAGYHIGRFVYILDALDDLQDDVAARRFNPLISYYGSAEAVAEHTAEIDETLCASSLRFSAAVGLAKDSIYTDILQNIARFGMENAIETVYDKYAYKRKEKEVL